MPDQYRFDHLGDAVRCIDCPTGGPIWQWPEPKRWRHARTHGSAPKAPATDVRRRGSLLAPPPFSNEEKKEAIMATTTRKGEPAKQVAIDVLRESGEPLRAKEISKRVLASGRCAGLKGKTPEATISAMLAVGSKPGGPFKRVDKGTYTVAEIATAASEPARPKPATTAKRSATAKPAATAKAKAKSTAKRTTTKRTAAKRSR
jgi:HB1, ASXL, restriction endonuclease HTH domain